MFLAMQNRQDGTYPVLERSATGSLCGCGYCSERCPVNICSNLYQCHAAYGSQIRIRNKNIEVILGPFNKLFIFIISATAAMVIIIPFVLPLVFGDEYVAAVPYAQVLALAFAFVGLKNVFIYLLRAWERNKPGFLSEGIASVILVTGAYPALQIWGVMGLSVVMVLAHALGTLSLLYFFLKTTGLSAHQLFGLARRSVLGSE